MEDNTHAITPHMIRSAAALLGSMNARGGDTYDVLEGFSAGWAEQLATGALTAASSVYTTPGQGRQTAEVTAGPFAGGAQGPPAPVSKEQLRLQLAILADMRSAIESVIEWRVQDAREQRWSWAEIAEPLEITKQGAHKRYEIDRIRVSDMPRQ